MEKLKQFPSRHRRKALNLLGIMGAEYINSICGNIETLSLDKLYSYCGKSVCT